MFDKGRIQAISFDAAATLIVPGPSVGAVYAEVLLDHGLPSEPTVLEQNFYTAFKSWRASRNGALLDRKAWQTIVRSSLQEACPEANFEAVFDDLWNTFAQGRRWRILPGVVESLSRLKAADYRLGVLSNNDTRMHSVLRDLELSPFFEVILASTEIGAEKPDRAAFSAMQHALGLPPEAILHVGDRPEEDIVGALNAGWQGCLLGPPEKCPAGAFAVADMSALCDTML